MTEAMTQDQLDALASAQPSTRDTREPKHIVFSGDAPLIIAIDCTASMLTADAGKTRADFVVERIDELLRRVPNTTRVTLLAFDDDVHVLACNAMPDEARQALGPMPMGARCNTGRVLEWCVGWHEQNMLDQGKRIAVYDPATLVIVTDGYPDDQSRYMAWLEFALKYEVLGAVVVLTLGYAASDDAQRSRFTLRAMDDRRGEPYVVDDGDGDDGVESRRPKTWCVPLTADTEIHLSTRTASDAPDAARAPTVPPSISPPRPQYTFDNGRIELRERIAEDVARAEAEARKAIALRATEPRPDTGGNELVEAEQRDADASRPTLNELDLVPHPDADQIGPVLIPRSQRDAPPPDSQPSTETTDRPDVATPSNPPTSYVDPVKHAPATTTKPSKHKR